MAAKSKRNRKGAHSSLLLAALALLGGVYVAAQTPQHSLNFRSAPESAAGRKNPYEGQALAVRAGAELFKRHCAQCHGGEARGTKRAPALNSAAVREAAPGALYWFLTNGDRRRGMPSWAGLPGPRRWQLVTYLQGSR